MFDREVGLEPTQFQHARCQNSWSFTADYCSSAPGQIQAVLNITPFSIGWSSRTRTCSNSSKNCCATITPYSSHKLASSSFGFTSSNITTVLMYDSLEEFPSLNGMNSLLITLYSLLNLDLMMSPGIGIHTPSKYPS